MKFLQTTGKMVMAQRQAGGALCLHSPGGCCFEVLHVELLLGFFPLGNNHTTFALNQGGVEN